MGTVADIRAQIETLQAQLAEAEAIEAEAARAAELKEAQAAFDAMLAAMVRLIELNRLPEPLKVALTDSGGSIVPARFLKRPRK